jgi:hypothetical protein
MEALQTLHGTQDETPQPWQLQPDSRPQPKPAKREKSPKFSKDFERFCNWQGNQLPPATELEEHFRHSGWSARRKRVLEILPQAGTSSFAVDRFACCGSDAIVEWSPEEKRHRVRANFCHNRHCEPCARAKGLLLTANLRTKLEDVSGMNFRFITLTLKHSDDSLHDQIKRLYACYKKLRNTKLWKLSQIGGAAMLEVKWNPTTRKWHPHLHVISEGKFINAHDLSATWLAITGDSKIVDVRLIKSGKDAAFYVAKYCAKGTSNEVWQDREAAIEWVTATRGVRTCATFGKWRGWKLLEHPKTADDWKPIARLDKVLEAARAGEIWAQDIVKNLKTTHQDAELPWAAAQKPPDAHI